MTEYLTQENGVYCRHCFKTINLTKIEWKPHTKWFKVVDQLAGRDDHFKFTCPYCNNTSFYSYERDVKPISNWPEMDKFYKRKIEEIIIKYLDVKGDNIEILKQKAIEELTQIKYEPQNDKSEDPSKPKNDQFQPVR